jgi:hypothetical protein
MVSFAVAMMLGVAVYLRIWSIDSSFTADDREILRFVLLPPSILQITPHIPLFSEIKHGVFGPATISFFLC